jgi:DNA-binding response OmpR family regulator
MEKQYLVIHNNTVLYNILFELKHLLSFEVIKTKNKNLDNVLNDKQSLVISSDNLESKNQVFIDSLPISIDKLIYTLNIQFLKKKIENKKNIKIGNYIINYTSRKIQKKNKSLIITEKEVAIINFLNHSNRPRSINELQIEVWGHKSKLETHTVETHVYRLRKKIKEYFNDNNFIKSSKDGYLI